MLTNTLIALVYFLFALLVAMGQMEFLKVREERRALAAANIDFCVTAVHAVSLVLLVTMTNWQVLVAEAIANWIGTYHGVRRLGQ